LSPSAFSVDKELTWDHGNSMTRLTIRIDFDSGASLGPGKIKLLEEVERTGSIRNAAEAVGMSFRQAWLLLKAIEEMFGQPVIVTARGGARGGGSSLTELGRLAVTAYRTLEEKAHRAGHGELAVLTDQIAVGDLSKSGPSRKRLKTKR
jgi:molybdate transport system regulatory protein